MDNLPQLHIKNAAELVFYVKGLVIGSFEKKFGDYTDAQVVSLFRLACRGLSQSQLNTGLQAVEEHGFAPDPALFRRWCLGLKGFDHTDAIADSYIGRHGALGNIIRWLQSNGKSTITAAEKQAYDQTYHLWQSIHSTSDNTHAELAFKDAYEQIVAALVAARTPCQVYVPAVAIAQAQQQASTQAQTVNDPAQLQAIFADIERSLGVAV